MAASLASSHASRDINTIYCRFGIFLLPLSQSQSSSLSPPAAPLLPSPICVSSSSSVSGSVAALHFALCPCLALLLLLLLLPGFGCVVVIVVLFFLFFSLCCLAAILLLDFCGLSARSHIKIDWIPVKLISQVNAVAQSLLRHPHSPDIPTPASLDCSSAEAVVNYAPRLVFYIKRQTPAPEIATVYWPGQAWKLQAGSYKLESAGAGCCSPALLALPGSVKIFDHLGSHGIYFALAWHISAAFY